MKTVDLEVRPIFLRTAEHVEAHIFLCMLAYYVDWHLRQAWSSLLFAEEDLETMQAERDPVAQATPSAAARAKKQTHANCNGVRVQAFGSLLSELSTQCRNECSIPAAPTNTFTLETEPTDTKAAADGPQTEAPTDASKATAGSSLELPVQR